MSEMQLSTEDSSMAGEATGLAMLAEKTLQTPIHPNLMAYCPNMDLLALATTDDQVHVYRLNGQKVLGISKVESTGGITDLRWKPNGQSLAAAFGNTLCIASAHTGKVMYKNESSTPTKAPITCLGWASNLTDVRAVRTTMAEVADNVSLDDFVTSFNEAASSQKVPDLPNELAFIDVASSMPKLSTLPTGGLQSDIFSSRLSLDTMFRPPSADLAGHADVLVVGHEDGTINLSMSEDFAIGSFHLRDVEPDLSHSKPIMHCSHPLSTTHALLVSSNSPSAEELHIVPFDLRLISNAGRYLSLLAAKVTELHNLLRYLRQVQEQISTEIRTSHALPNRFMGNIDETLKDKCDCTWVQGAFHLAVTGHCFPEVEEWLVEELGERGLKRWDKVVVTGYETVRRLGHENLLPALDRLSVLVSRLRGLSRFQPSGVFLGLSTLELDNMLDSVSCLQLVSHQLLRSTDSELQQFGAFSAWLRHEIEKQAADPTSVTAQEIAEKDLNFDHASILEYIQGAMTQNRVAVYSGKSTDDESRRNLNVEGGHLFDLYRKHLHHSLDSHSPKKPLPGLDGLIDHVQKQSTSLFERIAETQRRNVHFGAPTLLGVGNSACTDIRMVDEKDNDLTVSFSIYVAVGPSATQDCVKIFLNRLIIENGVSSTRNIESATIPVPGGAVRSLRFIDDDALVLAFAGQDDVSRLLKLDYRSHGKPTHNLRYQQEGLTNRTMRGKTQKDIIAESTGIDLTKPKSIADCTIYTFPTDPSWAPKSLEVNGRKGRRMICVLADDRIHYRQFDMDSSGELNGEATLGDEGGDHDEAMSIN